jgi:hypothetical protein
LLRLMGMVAGRMLQVWKMGGRLYFVGGQWV